MIGHVCDAWESATAIEDVMSVPCRTAVSLGQVTEAPRFAYVSAASPLEKVLGEPTRISDRSGSEVSIVELCERLLDREVAALLSAPGPNVGEPGDSNLALPFALVQHRASLREQLVQARFLLRQIGLEEVSSHRGAHPQLYDKLATLWSQELSMCVDPAMMLSLGADRQRYVDTTFRDRAKDRLPRAVGRLDDLGVRSYPRLVIV